MLTVSKPNGRPKAAVVRLDSVLASCHLIPKFGRVAPRTWEMSGVLDECTEFFVNSYLSLDTFAKIRHGDELWRLLDARRLISR